VIYLIKGQASEVHGTQPLGKGPRSWLDLWDTAASLAGYHRASFYRFATAKSANRIVVDWAPSYVTAFVGTLFGRLCLVYWGGHRLGRSYLLNEIKKWKHFFVTKAATRIILNESVTLKQLPGTAQSRSIVLSHFVDTNFFVPSLKEKVKTIVVPGDIDRDELAAEAFVSWGFRVIRVARSRVAVPPGVVLRTNVSWTELRDLYQEAILTFLPMQAQHHIGGQTAMLESLACGTPVLTNSVRLWNRYGETQGVHFYSHLNKVSVGQAIAGIPVSHSAITTSFGFDVVARHYAAVLRSINIHA
jgi:hypothetical protein